MMKLQRMKLSRVFKNFDETDQIVVPLCILPVDLSPLKPFKKVLGLQGYYYRVSFDLTVSFGPELLFQLVHEGRVIGSISAKYA